MQMYDVDKGVWEHTPTQLEIVLAWAGVHWFLAILLLLTLSAIVHAPFRAYKRYLRARNIREHGWPPPHLDADGNFKGE